MTRGGVDVRLRIEGHHLPGRRCGPYADVHVALQVGRDPVDLVPGDAASAAWETGLAVVPASDGTPDVRGPVVQGRRGERFAYLVWGSTTAGDFEVFRRAKLMLAALPALVDDGEPRVVTARVDLTDDQGMPRCARLAPPAVEWSRS